MIARRAAPRMTRRGYTLLEATMAAMVLIAAMSLTVKALGMLAQERRQADRRTLALQEIANAMDRVVSKPYREVDSERARAISSEGGRGAELPGAEWSAEVTEGSEAELKHKRVELRLRWKGMSGEWLAPVRLVAWMYTGRSGD